MDNFTFYAPTYFAFGKDAEHQAGALVKRFGGHKVLLHYGGRRGHCVRGAGRRKAEPAQRSGL